MKTTQEAMQEAEQNNAHIEALAAIRCNLTDLSKTAERIKQSSTNAVISLAAHDIEKQLDELRRFIRDLNF